MTPPTEAQEQWGPWIEHDGKGCPCKGMYAQWFWDNGTPRAGFAGINTVCRHTGVVLGPSRGNVPNAWCWSSNPSRRVVRYRIRKPRALVEMIQRVEALPSQPERVDA